jgi:hypothetical protein
LPDDALKAVQFILTHPGFKSGLANHACNIFFRAITNVLIISNLFR